ncbi:MAG: Lpg1974 family pore-forming outer membrane protein [Pirellulaceae bacterium]
MKLRYLVTVTAVALLLVGGQPLSAQQMAPYGMPQMSPYGMPGAYPPAAPMGQQAAYAPPAPSPYDIPQQPLDGPGLSGSQCYGSGCGQAGCSQCACSNECWYHRVAVFGELLYLQARNAEVTYGMSVNPDNTLQAGRLGVVEQDYDPGFRFGFGYVLDGCSSLTAQYTHFETARTDLLDPAGTNVVNSLVTYPGQRSFPSAQASHDIEFQFLDVDYRRVLSCADDHNVAFLVGVRAGQYEQEFSADFLSTPGESVDTEIDFYGAGLRLGLEGERYSGSRRWLVYGKTYGNFVAGDFTADYRQSSDALPVDTTWKAGRIVSMLDLEVGAGWQSRCGTWRITGGYMISAWFNTVKTDEWIDAVQSDNYVGLSDSISFDGLVVRCEGRF